MKYKVTALSLALAACGGPSDRASSHHSDLVTIYPTSIECIGSEGYTIVTAQDTNDDGIIDSGDINMQSYAVCNGTNGSNGAAGPAGADAPPSAYTPVQAVEPCGAASSSYKEVLLVLASGDVLSSFSVSSSGQDTRLTFLPDGNYTDTDESGCQFNIATSGVTRTISWDGGNFIFSVPALVAHANPGAGSW